MKRLLLPLAALAIAGLLAPSVRPAYACTCAYLTPAEQVGQANVVVIGTIVDVKFEGPIDEIAGELELGHGVAHQPDTTGLLRTRVERYLKGDGVDHVTVEQKATAITKNLDGSAHVEFTGGPNCALFSGLPLNERYLLFLYRNENDRFGTGWCSGSLRLDATALSYPYTSRDSYVATLAEYDAAFGLPPGSLLSVANSEISATELPLLGSAPPVEQPGADMPWLVVAGAASLAGAAAVAVSGLVLRRLTRP